MSSEQLARNILDELGNIESGEITEGLVDSRRFVVLQMFAALQNKQADASMLPDAHQHDDTLHLGPAFVPEIHDESDNSWNVDRPPPPDMYAELEALNSASEPRVDLAPVADDFFSVLSADRETLEGIAHKLRALVERWPEDTVPSSVQLFLQFVDDNIADMSWDDRLQKRAATKLIALYVQSSDYLQSDPQIKQHAVEVSELVFKHCIVNLFQEGRVQAVRTGIEQLLAV